MESAASAIETRMSSSSQGMDRISETTSYETAIAGTATDSNVESRTAKITLDTDASKPVFIKTIEGCNVERKYATSKLSTVTVILLLIDNSRRTKIALNNRWE